MDDIKMIDGDFYCTVDKDDLQAGRRLLFLEAAYKLARVTSVQKTRKEAAGTFDAAKIQEHVEAVLGDIDSLAKIARKAAAVKKNGGEMEEALLEMHRRLDGRLNQILELLRLDEAT